MISAPGHCRPGHYFSTPTTDRATIFQHPLQTGALFFNTHCRPGHYFSTPTTDRGTIFQHPLQTGALEETKRGKKSVQYMIVPRAVHVCMRVSVYVCARACVCMCRAYVCVCVCVCVSIPAKYGFTRLSSPSLSPGGYQQPNVYV